MPLCSKCFSGSHPKVNNKLLTKTNTTFSIQSPISSLTPLPVSLPDSPSFSHSDLSVGPQTPPPCRRHFQCQGLALALAHPPAMECPFPKSPHDLTPLLLQVFTHIPFSKTPSLLKLFQLSVSLSTYHYQTFCLFILFIAYLLL